LSSSADAELVRDSYAVVDPRPELDDVEPLHAIQRLDGLEQPIDVDGSPERAWSCRPIGVKNSLPESLRIMDKARCINPWVVVVALESA
jgi:hypothetical protein